MAHWIALAGGSLSFVAGRDADRRGRLAASLHASPASLDVLDSSDCDLLLIAVSDRALPEVAEKLAGRRQAPVALHTAGALTAEAIRALRAAGSTVGSLHPLKSFPQALLDPAEGRGVVFGIDGDPRALETAESLARAVGGRSVHVPAPARLLYHLAATLASGGVVTLLAAADAIARRSGLDEGVLEGYLELARGSLERAATLRPVATAITGPVARGDRDTVAAELKALSDRAPDLTALVTEIARATLALLPSTGEDDEGPQADLRRYLERGD